MPFLFFWKRGENVSDSVGKISLDLELQGDLGKQINESAEKIGAQLKASLHNIGNINFKALADGHR